MRRPVEWRIAARALIVILSLTPVSPVFAHEVRPAYLQITEQADHGYEVLWKQPVVGDLAVHLAPHLSAGWLDEPPAGVEVTNSYAIKSWTIHPHNQAPLDGQIVSIEGLENTLTNALLVVRLADGSSWHAILTPAQTHLALHPKADSNAGTLAFLISGIEHILTGADHLLFVLGLLLIVKEVRMLLKTITAFTLAHSITLAMATLGYANLPLLFLNAAIALSIAFLGAECIPAQEARRSLTRQYPWIVAFLFGLLHGFGFASGLTAAGLPGHDIPLALVLFNAGVEIGQLAFLVLVLWLGYAFRVLAIRWPRPIQAMPAYVIGTLGVFWTFQRLGALLGGSA